MIIVSCCTQVLVLIKSSVVASIFGASMPLDAYNFANSIISFLFGFVSAGISTIVLPEYVRKTERRVVDGFLTTIYCVLFAILCLLIVLRSQLIGVISSREDAFVQLASSLLLVLVLAQAISSVEEITTTYFQTIGKYNFPKIISLFVQLVIVIILIVVDKVSIQEYTFVIVCGTTVNAIINIIAAISNGWRFKPVFFNAQSYSLLKRFVPVLLSSGIYHLSLVIDSSIASRLEAGMLTVLSYSGQIVRMINALLITNLVTYCYPKIVALFSTQKDQKQFWKMVCFFHLIVCFIIAGFIVVGRQGIKVILQHGAFTSEACQLVYVSTVIYVLGQQTNIVRDLIYRFFYAAGETKTPAVNSVWVSIINILVSIALVFFIGFYGIIIGTVCASLISTIMIIMKFTKKYSARNQTISALSIIFRNLVSLCITVFVVYITQNAFPINNDLIYILVYGIQCTIVFGLVSLIILPRDIIHLQILKRHK